MKGHSLLVSLAIAILIVGSLVVGSRIATPDQPIVDENPKAEDYNSSESNTISIKVGEDITGKLWIGIARTTNDGIIRIGTHGGDSVEVRFSEFGDITVSEPRHSPEFDGKILEAIDEALSLWTKEMTTGGAPIGINEEGLSKEEK